MEHDRQSMNEVLFLKDFLELSSSLSEMNIKKWFYNLPKGMKEEYSSFIIYRIKGNQLRLILSFISFSNKQTINWSVAIEQIVQKIKNDTLSLIPTYFLLNLLDIGDEEKELIFNKLFSTVEENQKIEIKAKIIEIINGFDWTKVSNNKLLTLQDWDRLIRQLEYLYHGFSPLTPFYSYIQYSGDPDILSLLIKMGKYPFAFFIANRNITYILLEHFDEFMSLIAKNDFTIQQYQAYLTHMPDYDFKYFKVKTFEKIISDYWEDFGILLFRKFFSHLKRDFTIDDFTEHKKILKDILTDYYSNSNFSFIDDLVWPTDFIGLVRCLVLPSDDNKYSFEPSSGFLNSIAKNILHTIGDFNENMVTDGSFYVSKIIPNALDTDMYIAICILSNAFLECDDDNYKQLKRELQNWIYISKPLFYSGFSGVQIGISIIEIILIFLTAIVSIEGLPTKAFTRIKEICNLISKDILYSFVRYTERDEDIWNYERKLKNPNTSNYQSQEKYLINHHLQVIWEKDDMRYHEAFKNLSENWIKYANAHWPWFDSYANTIRKQKKE